MNRILRVTACGAFALAAALSHASDLSVVNVSQASPGEVVVRVGSVGAGAPSAGSLGLQLGNGQAIQAASVVPVAATATPVALLLCLDRSGSMGTAAITAMKNAIREALLTQDPSPTLPFQVAFLTFATRTTPLLNLTNDRASVDAAITGFALENDRDGKSRLYDAVAGGLAELRATDVATKRLIVASDGDDEDSRISQKELIRQAISTSIPIDAIGFGSRAASRSGSLATMAGATNGSFQVASGGAELSTQLAAMIRRALPQQQFDVTFHYGAATSGAASEQPSLIYTPAQGVPSTIPMNVSVAAMEGAESAGDANGWFHWTAVRHAMQFAGIDHKLAGWPVHVWIGVSALALLLIVLTTLWLRSRLDESEESRVAVNPDLNPLPPTNINDRPASAPPAPPDQPWPSRPPSPPPASTRPQTMVRFQWPSPGDGRLVAVLVVQHGAAARRRIDIQSARTTIGSAPDSDVVVEGDDFVSGHHALVRAESGGLYLVDLGSTNGSELNGERFKDATRALSPGDRVTLGRTALEVMTAAAAYPRQPNLEQRVR